MRSANSSGLSFDKNENRPVGTLSFVEDAIAAAFSLSEYRLQQTELEFGRTFPGRFEMWTGQICGPVSSKMSQLRLSNCWRAGMSKSARPALQLPEHLVMGPRKSLEGPAATE